MATLATYLRVVCLSPEKVVAVAWEPVFPLIALLPYEYVQVAYSMPRVGVSPALWGLHIGLARSGVVTWLGSDHFEG